MFLIAQIVRFTRMYSGYIWVVELSELFVQKTVNENINSRKIRKECVQTVPVILPTEGLGRQVLGIYKHSKEIKKWVP